MLATFNLRLITYTPTIKAKWNVINWRQKKLNKKEHNNRLVRGNTEEKNYLHLIKVI